MSIIGRLPAALAIIASAPLAQTPPPPKFEVASIKPTLNIRTPMGQGGNGVGLISGQRYDNANASMKALIMAAYAFDPRLIVAPDWVNEVELRFAVHAVMPEGATKEQLPDMLKALLEERFHLIAHRAMVDDVAYALVTDKNGPKLRKPTDLDRSQCDDWHGVLVGLSNPGNQTCSKMQGSGDQRVVTMMGTGGRFGPSMSTTTFTPDCDPYMRNTTESRCRSWLNS